jgi:hypothetical protein
VSEANGVDAPVRRVEERMGKQYLVWREGSDRGDGKTIVAYYPQEAAEKWAAWSDSWYADYTIVHGQEERVFVALDEEGSTAELFEVSGEPCPVYHARAMSA